MYPEPSEVFNVAILVDTATSWSRSLIRGILQYTKQHGPWHIHLEPQSRDDKLHLPKYWRGDGIIARVSTDRMAGQLDQLRTAVVNISAIPLQRAYYPRVVTSPDSEAKLAFGVLRSRGFRQFAYAGDVTLNHVANHFCAFERILKKEGYAPQLYCPKTSGPLGEWLKGLPRPIAVYCWETEIGHKIIDTCLALEISVPHDVAVLGSTYDELLSEASYPPQAGILMATEQIGRTAAMILDGMMKGEKSKKKEWHIMPLGVMERLSIDALAVDDDRMARVMAYLRKHALEPITVPDVLKANPMARRSLERKFQRCFGCSVVEQIQRLRIQHARALLAETEAPMSAIAEQCCFSSYNYLHRIFKQSTGLSPSQYRAQFRAVKGPSGT